MENKLIIRQGDRILCRHYDDRKPFPGSSESSKNQTNVSNVERIKCRNEDSYVFQPVEENSRLISLRCSSRLRKENKRFADYILE